MYSVGVDLEGVVDDNFVFLTQYPDGTIRGESRATLVNSLNSTKKSSHSSKYHPRPRLQSVRDIQALEEAERERVRAINEQQRLNVERALAEREKHLLEETRIRERNEQQRLYEDSLRAEQQRYDAERDRAAREQRLDDAIFKAEREQQRHERLRAERLQQHMEWLDDARQMQQQQYAQQMHRAELEQARLGNPIEERNFNYPRENTYARQGREQESYEAFEDRRFESQNGHNLPISYPNQSNMQGPSTSRFGDARYDSSRQAESRRDNPSHDEDVTINYAQIRWFDTSKLTNMENTDNNIIYATPTNNREAVNYADIRYPEQITPQLEGKSSYLLRRTNNYLKAIEDMRGAPDDIEPEADKYEEEVEPVTLREKQPEKGTIRKSVAGHISMFERNSTAPPPVPPPLPPPGGVFPLNYVERTDSKRLQPAKPKIIPQGHPEMPSLDSVQKARQGLRPTPTREPRKMDELPFIVKLNHIVADQKRLVDGIKAVPKPPTREANLPPITEVVNDTKPYEPQRTMGKATISRKLTKLYANGPPVHPSLKPEPEPNELQKHFDRFRNRANYTENDRGGEVISVITPKRWVPPSRDQQPPLAGQKALDAIKMNGASHGHSKA